MPDKVHRLTVTFSDNPDVQCTLACTCDPTVPVRIYENAQQLADAARAHVIAWAYASDL